MDNGPVNTSIIQEHASIMYGKVLVTGLGMCCMLDCLRKNDNVDSVVCVDIEPQLIRYFENDYPNVFFIQADAKTWIPSEHFDFIWHDIFSDFNESTIKEYEELKSKYAPYCDTVFGLFDGYYEVHKLCSID